MTGSMKMFGWKSGTCWKNCQEIPGNLGLGAFAPTIFPAPSAQPKVHCKQHGSPQHPLLERFSSMFRGKLRARNTAICDITVTSKIHWKHMQIET